MSATALCFFLPSGQLDRTSVRLFWKLDFYTSPILLENVSGNEALGFTVDPFQHSITFQQPWNKSLRSIRNSGPRSAVMSGIYARLRLILMNTFPRELQIAQIQDLMGLLHCLDPELLCPPERSAIMTLIHKFHRRVTSDIVFVFC